MESFFQPVLDNDVLKKALPIFRKLDNCKLRSLRSDLRRNDALRSSVNEGKITIEQLVEMSFEELADEVTKEKRKLAKIENLQSALTKKNLMSKADLDVLTNKIEDPWLYKLLCFFDFIVGKRCSKALG